MAVDTLDLGLPHLNVVDTIGRGGFSVVYKAIDTKLNRPVAVKVLTGIADEAGLERFDQECQIHGPLSNHPNIVTIHDAGFTPTGSPFLVMEYLDGGALTDFLEANGRLEWQKAIEWMAPVCDAVHTAHRMGVLHRDIKPANILVSPDGPKLADFGIACVTDATSPQFAVSWLHAPPEAELNRRDERSDVYSLASTMFQLLTGAAPYWRDGDESLAALLTRMATEPVPNLPPSIAPPALDQLLQRALAKDPALRPASAAEFGAALSALATSPVWSNTDNRATAVLPVATQILPTSSPTIDTASTVHHGGLAAQSGPAGGGPLVVGGPHAVSVGTGSPATAGRPVTVQPHPLQPHSLQPHSQSHSQPHPQTNQQSQQFVSPYAASPGQRQQRRRSKKLPVAAAVVALATVAFFLRPAWAALQPASTVDQVGVGGTTTTTADEQAVSTTEPVPDSTSTTARSTTTEDTDTTDSPDTSDTTDSPDTSDTTDSPDTSDTTDSPDTSDTTSPPPPPPVEVPNVADLTAESASQVLTDDGFTNITAVSVPSDTVAAGLVIATDPAAEQLVDPDDQITMHISSGPSPVAIPDLEGETPDAAIAALEELGLEPTIEIVELEEDSPLDGRVTGTTPGPGAEVAVGSTVTVRVGESPSGPIVTIDPEIVEPTVSIPSTTVGILLP
ncbi:MAG: protein kinase domain-containing protein [Acidimicrobiales bacterium]